jgi:hypothetical protein
MFFKSFVNTYPGISVKLIIVLFTTLKARARTNIYLQVKVLAFKM